jgi:hypothetical protein
MEFSPNQDAHASCAPAARPAFFLPLLAGCSGALLVLPTASVVPDRGQSSLCPAESYELFRARTICRWALPSPARLGALLFLRCRDDPLSEDRR